MDSTLKLVIKRNHEMSEGPYWCRRRNALFYIEMWKKEIHKYIPETDEHFVAKVTGDVDCVTFVIPFESPLMNDCFVVGVNNKLGYVKWDERSDRTGKVCFVEQMDSSDSIRLNDAKISPSGILFTGSMAKRGPDGTHAQGVGNMFKYVNGQKSVVIEAMTIPNGITWSNDEKLFYVVESATGDILQFDYERRTGNLSNRCTLINWKVKKIKGFPDGMTIDENDNLWVATFSGKSVVCISTASATVLRKIEIPAYQVTSVTFGGPNLDELYVTTASLHLTKKEMQQPALLSGLYKIENLGITGAASIPFLP